MTQLYRIIQKGEKYEEGDVRWVIGPAEYLPIPPVWIGLRCTGVGAIRPVLTKEPELATIRCGDNVVLDLGETKWNCIVKDIHPIIKEDRPHHALCPSLTYSVKLVTSGPPIEQQEENMSSITTDGHGPTPKQTFVATEEIVIGGVKSSKGPPLHLIPTEALVELANRFQLGIERKGDGAWNALSPNQQCLTNRELLIDRCSHIIHHALKLRDCLLNKESEESIVDNAAAVAWGGVFLICAGKAIEK